MHDIAAIALNAMRLDTLRLERTAINLANTGTAGFQREYLVSMAREAGISDVGNVADSTARPTLAGSDAAPTLAVMRDLRPGALRPTGQALDVALLSGGYFEIITPAGATYTRRGDFHRDALGRLVNAQGWPVMGRDGEITLNLDPGRVQIDGDGHVSADGQRLGQLKIVDFDASTAMTHLDGGSFTTSAPARTRQGGGMSVRQGVLENANVNPGQEMLDLMRTTRHFESMSRVLQGHDEMLGNAIRRLGEV